MSYANNRIKALTELRWKLKTGNYDGSDIIFSWLAIDELISYLEKEIRDGYGKA